jgi:hypothetical protein
MNTSLPQPVQITRQDFRGALREGPWPEARVVLLLVIMGHPFSFSGVRTKGLRYHWIFTP